MPFGCVWEWLKGWINDSDLPKVQSIQLGFQALWGDPRDSQKEISEVPFNWKNTLIMRSVIEWNGEWTDLPSLNLFKGEGDNFNFIGSVILESDNVVHYWNRYPWIIRWNWIWKWMVLQVYLLHSIIKYDFCSLISIRFSIAWIIHQKQMVVCLILCFIYSMYFEYNRAPKRWIIS